MTKKVFNRFDPFMPVKLTGQSIKSDSVDTSSDEFFEDFNKVTLNQSLKYSTPRVKNGFSVLLTSCSIGNKNGLGEKLMADFIFSLSNSFELPQYILLVNEAIFLLNDSKMTGLFSTLKKLGVKILVSMESIEFFKSTINSKVVIQAASGDIAEKILFSSQLVTL